MDERIAIALRQGATVVTAGRRLARALTREYNRERQAQGAKAWQAPDIAAWGGWIGALWEDYLYSTGSATVRLGPWQERALWERVLEEAPEAAGLLQASAAAAAAQEAWNLALAWRMDPSSIEAEGNEDARAFAAWVRRFEGICHENRWVPGARTADLLAAAIGRLKLPGRVVLAGFDELTPQQAALAEACRRTGCEVTQLPPGTGTIRGAAVRVAFADSTAELTAAARWVRSLVDSGAGASIAVVVPDLPARRRQVERIFRSVLEPGTLLPGGRTSGLTNFSAGDPLAAFPVIAAAFGILALRPGGNDWRQISTLVRDPHLGGAETEHTARGLLDAALRSKAGAEVPLARVLQLCEAGRCPLLKRALSGWQRAYERAPGQQSPAGWSRTFSAMLEAAGWPGERPLDSLEYQTVQAWSGLLSEFAGTDATRGAVSMEQALSLLRRMAAGTMFQPESPEAPVQILGSLEAAGMRFDHLWVAGLHDEAWPEPARPNPFLPVRLQRAAGLPHSSPERELAVARRITQRLLASADDLVLSYPLLDGDRDLAPSPLILGVRKGDAGELPQGAFADYRRAIFDSRLTERVVDEQGPPVANAARQRGGTRVFQYQAACPFRAFAELRLGAEPLEAPAPGLDPRERGTLVHLVLEAVWSELKTHEALSTRTDVPELIAEAMEEAIRTIEERRGARLPERYAALERQRTGQLVAEWLEIEKGREPFEVVLPEGERYIDVGGIRCKVQPDRIDRLRDGREIIIDYKTGVTSPAKWDSDRPDEPQIPLYGVTHPNPLAGVLFAQIRPGDAKFKGCVDGAQIPGVENNSLAEHLETWRGVLERLAGDFRAGRAEPDPKKPGESCRYCKLALLCRTSEAGMHLREEPV